VAQQHILGLIFVVLILPENPRNPLSVRKFHIAAVEELVVSEFVEVVLVGFVPFAGHALEFDGKDLWVALANTSHAWLLTWGIVVRTYDSANDVEDSNEPVQRHADNALEERNPRSSNPNQRSNNGETAHKGGVAQGGGQRAPVMTANECDAESENHDAKEELEAAQAEANKPRNRHPWDLLRGTEMLCCVVLCCVVWCCVMLCVARKQQR
jgi:hypothetical protein